MNIADALLGKDAAMAERASGVQPGARVHRLADDHSPDPVKRNAQREAWHGKTSAAAAKHLPPVAAQPTTAARSPSGLRIDPPSKDQMPAKFAEETMPPVVTTTHEEPPAEIPVSDDFVLLRQIHSALRSVGERGIKDYEIPVAIGRTHLKLARIVDALQILQVKGGAAVYDDESGKWRDPLSHEQYRKRADELKPTTLDDQPPGITDRSAAIRAGKAAKVNGVRHKLRAPPDPPRVAAPESSRLPIEVARFGEYVVLKRVDLLDLAALFRAVEQWRDAIEGIA